MAAVEDQAVTTGSAKDESRLQDLAKRHLWMHFTQMAGYEDHEIPIITRGDGCYVWDEHGNRYLDGLAALFCVNIGHGRGDVAQAGADQAKELGFYTNWSYAHPKAIELAARVAELAPGDLNRVFFTSGGSEAVDSALKLCRQYHKLTGNPGRYKVDLAQARLPRHHHGRADRDRHPGRPAPVRAAVPRLRARAEHERLPARGRRPGRGDLRADPVRGPGDRLVRDPRAGAELGRLLHAPRGLLPARARDLRRVRDRLHLRRGDLQLGPPRHLLRRREVRLPARHHHDGQGHHVLLRPDGRGDRHRPHLRAVLASPATRSPTGSRSAATRSPRRSRSPTSTCSPTRGSSRTCVEHEQRVRRRCSTRCATSRSSATCAAPATSARSSWSATRRPRRPSPARRRSGCCAASSRPRCSGAG